MDAVLLVAYVIKDMFNNGDTATELTVPHMSCQSNPIKPWNIGTDFLNYASKVNDLNKNNY